MIVLKDLINDLGGGRSLTIGAILVLCSYVAANHYVITVEERLKDLNERLKPLERALQRYEAFESQGSRFSGEQGTSLQNRIERLERELDHRNNTRIPH